MIATKKHKYPPAEEALLPSSRELPTFRELYLAAFQGLHTIFEQYNDNDPIESNGLVVYYDGEDQDSVLRSRHLAWVAYNSATEACKLLAEQDTLANFNQKA